MAHLERGDRFVDPSVNAFHGEVSVNEDRFGTGEWRVEYFDDDGGCYITIFAGPGPRGGRATISTHSRLVVLVSNENPSRSSLSRMSEIPRGAIFGRRVGDPPKGGPSISSAARPAAAGSIAVISRGPFGAYLGPSPQIPTFSLCAEARAST